MKTIIGVCFMFFVNGLLAQNKHTKFYDTAQQLTTWEDHWAFVVKGDYKSFHNKKANKRVLIRTTDAELREELEKTRKRIVETDKLGQDLPDFNAIDLNGNQVSKAALKGKVLVLNFWFIGCPPCEMERSALNDLQKAYANNDQIVFISFARNNAEDLGAFLPTHPVLYTVVPTAKDFIKSKFGIVAYPSNVVADRNGKYIFDSTASGVGIKQILKEQIELALNTN